MLWLCRRSSHDASLHEAINGNVANPYCVPSTFDEHGPPVQDRFARWSHGRTSMHVPKLPLVDVASQILGAEGPAGGGSRSSTLQAEMKHFEHEAFGAEEEPARNNVPNNPVMGEPTSASACRLSPCRHWTHNQYGWA